MTLLFCRTLLGVLPLLALAGCDKDSTKRASAVMLSAAGPVRTGTAIIRGTVTLSGKPPVMQTILNQPCHSGSKPLNDESVIVDGAGNIRNVVVSIEAPPEAPADAKPPPIVLDQVDCRYAPHVVAIRTGQTLRVTSSDPTLHNVHGLCTENTPFNFALVAPGQSRDLVFDRPEIFQVRCDVHPWMRAYVHVFGHPYFAVTGQDGTFEIKNVPSGSYTMVAWHEKYGLLRTRVTVADGKICSAQFTFQSGL